MRRALALSAVIALFAALSACGALIGIKTLIEPDDGDAGDASAADASGDGGPLDTSVPDAPRDGGCGDACVPVALATGQGQVSGIALDSTYVYFASFTSDFVARVPKAGGPVQKIATTGVSITRHIAVDATHVYWSSGDGSGAAVSRCPVTGCGGAPEVLATPNRPMGIAVDGTAVYWADRNSPELRKKPLPSGAEVRVADSTVGLPIAVAVDRGQLFWLGDFQGKVEGAAPDGGTFVVGANGASGRDLVLDETFVYWGAAVDVGADGRISRAPRTGAGPTDLVGPAKGEPVSLAVDGARIYWTAWQRQTNGDVVSAAVHACPTAGCGAGPTTLAAKQDLPRGIAVDDEAIYWGANGVVMKLAKP